MSSDVPALTSITAERAPNGDIRFRVSTLESGAVIDVNFPPELALMAVKLLTNALAGKMDLPDDQKC